MVGAVALGEIVPWPCLPSSTAPATSSRMRSSPSVPITRWPRRISCS